MSKYNSKTAVKDKNHNDVGMALTEYQPYNHSCKDSLYHVTDIGYYTCFLTKNPERVGRSGIAASLLADVNSVQLAINIACLKKSERISDNQTYKTLYNSFHDISCLLLLISLTYYKLECCTSKAECFPYLVLDISCI